MSHKTPQKLSPKIASGPGRARRIATATIFSSAREMDKRQVRRVNFASVQRPLLINNTILLSFLRSAIVQWDPRTSRGYQGFDLGSAQDSSCKNVKDLLKYVRFSCGAAIQRNPRSLVSDTIYCGILLYSNQQTVEDPQFMQADSSFFLIDSTCMEQNMSWFL